ncbi:MAG: ISL3 family transposase [Methanosarcina sp.]|nr:ISL3 family transposase [Methanosarcina sp.]
MYKELFQKGLNIEDPWYIKDIDFDPELKRLDIRIDFKKGSKFPCPKCGVPNCSIHDTIEKVWRHLNFFEYKTFLHCRVPRVKCGDCGVSQIKVPWARKQSGFTLLMDAMILMLAQSMPVLKVAMMLDEHDTRIWRVIIYYVKKSRAEENFSKVSKIGVDETSLKKGHKYVTIVADVENSKVIYVCEGKDSSTLTRFNEDLTNHGGKPTMIQYVSCDMSPAFINGISSEFPDAKITFDKFHVMKMMNEAVDEVRKQEQSTIKELKNSKYLWLKNEGNLSEKQKERFLDLKNQNLKTVRAYNVKLSLQEFWDSKNRKEAAQYLKKWYFWATHSRLTPITEAANTVEKHWDGILNYFDSKINNGILEGINSIVQLQKRNARGSKNVQYFINMIYSKLGKLKFELPI